MEIQDIDSFLDYWEKIRGRTRRVIACIPPDRFDRSHRPGAWTFADLIRHLAGTERWMFAENVAGRQSAYPGHGPELARTPEQVLDYLERAHAEAVDVFAALTPEDLRRKCGTPGGIELTAWKWLRAMVEHEIHHRGQIYLMLGSLGVETPPLYGLTEEEVRARSL